MKTLVTLIILSSLLIVSSSCNQSNQGNKESVDLNESLLNKNYIIAFNQDEEPTDDWFDTYNIIMNKYQSDNTIVLFVQTIDDFDAETTTNLSSLRDSIINNIETYSWGYLSIKKSGEIKYVPYDIPEAIIQAIDNALEN